MYIAMNRFKVQNGSEADFEAVWKNRDSSLAEMKGFREFHLLRGTVNEGRGLHAVCVAHGVGEPGRFRRLDQVGEFPRRAQECRHDEGALSRPPAIRGLFGRRGRLRIG